MTAAAAVAPPAVSAAICGLLGASTAVLTQAGLWARGTARKFGLLP